MVEANGLSLAESVELTKTLSLNTTNEKTASLLGAVVALLPMLLQIKGFAKTNNFHSTVKPIKLMEYLIKLVTPVGGIVLDPFMGSGSTGVAAKNLGFEFIGIEMNEEYVEIAERRINAVSS
jgi:DNA modification methylase